MGFRRSAGAIIELPDRTYSVASRQNPWRAPKAPGARFTRPQLAVMERVAISPDTLDTVRVYDKATSREMYWPETEQAPIYAINCPVLEIRPHGLRLVIAPDGSSQLAHESGKIVKDPLPWRRTLKDMGCGG